MDEFMNLGEGILAPPGFTAVPRLNEEGKELYLLPQPLKEITSTVISLEKTTTKTGNTPVMISERVPFLNEEGVQGSYRVTQMVEQENGTMTQEETGQILYLWTTKEVQEKNETDKLLYWKEVQQEVISYEEQSPIEITEENESYVEGLELAYDLIPYAEPSQPVYKSTEQIVKEQSNKIDLLSEQVNPKNADEVFVSLDIEMTPLDELKMKKVDQLSYFCNQEILSGFVSDALGVEHTYDFDYEAQGNLSAMLVLMNSDSTLTSTQWKTKDAGILNHSKEEFLNVCKSAQAHKQGKIGKYWTLKAQVQTSTDREEVFAIVW